MSATLEQLEGMTEDAYERGKAAGYAEAVADVVTDLITQGVGLNLMGKRQMSKYVASLVVKYSSGAHVGAAKKGAT